MEKQQLPNAKCHSQQQHSRQPQQHRPQQCHNHRPQTINIVVNIGTIVMPVNVTKGGKKEGGEQQPTQLDQLVNEVLAAVSKKLQQ